MSKLCYLCGQSDADSKDHIPPRSIFPKIPEGKQLITVYAHKKCNNSFSEDDDALKNLIIAFSYSSEKAKTAWERIKLGWTKNPNSKKKLQRNLTEENGKTILEMSSELLERNVIRWAKGLYYHRFKKPIPEDIKLKFYKLAPPKVSLNINLNQVEVEPSIFKYAYHIADENNDVGFIVFEFFNTEVYCVILGEELYSII